MPSERSFFWLDAKLITLMSRCGLVLVDYLVQPEAQGADENVTEQRESFVGTISVQLGSWSDLRIVGNS